MTKKKSGMYGERDRLKVGKYEISFWDGTEIGGLWVEDTTTGEGGQFHADALENALNDLWSKHF